jgi:lysyl-tRNA synthetase class I
MKQVTPKEGVELLFIDVPEGAREVDMEPTTEQPKVRYKLSGNLYFVVILPPGSWQLLGTTDSLTEEQKEELVERISMACNWWRNYVLTPQYYEYLCDSADKSWQSLLTANGIKGVRAILIKK